MEFKFGNIDGNTDEREISFDYQWWDLEILMVVSGSILVILLVSGRLNISHILAHELCYIYIHMFVHTHTYIHTWCFFVKITLVGSFITFCAFQFSVFTSRCCKEGKSFGGGSILSTIHYVPSVSSTGASFCYICSNDLSTTLSFKVFI